VASGGRFVESYSQTPLSEGASRALSTERRHLRPQAASSACRRFFWEAAIGRTTLNSDKTTSNFLVQLPFGQGDVARRRFRFLKNGRRRSARAIARRLPEPGGSAPRSSRDL